MQRAGAVGDRQQLLARDELVIRQVHELEGRPQPARHSLERLGERLLDGVGEHLAVLLAEFQFSARDGILIAAAGIEEQRGCARMVRLQVELGKTRIVAAPAGPREGGWVAGISEQDAQQLAFLALDGENRHVVINRAFQRRPFGQHLGHLRLGVLAAIDGERALAFPLEQFRRLEVVQGFRHRLDHLVFHPVRVLSDQLPLLIVQGVVVDQVVLEDGAAVVVREREHEFGTVQREAPVHLGIKALVDRLRHAHVIGGRHDRAFAVFRLESQHLDPKVMDLAVRYAPRSIPGQPHRGCRRNHAAPETRPPTQFLSTCISGGPARDQGKHNQRLDNPRQSLHG